MCILQRASHLILTPSTGYLLPASTASKDLAGPGVFAAEGRPRHHGNGTAQDEGLALVEGQYVPVVARTHDHLRVDRLHAHDVVLTLHKLLEELFSEIVEFMRASLDWLTADEQEVAVAEQGATCDL